LEANLSLISTNDYSTTVKRYSDIELRFADTHILNIIFRRDSQRDSYLGSPLDSSIIIRHVMNGRLHDQQ